MNYYFLYLSNTLLKQGYLLFLIAPLFFQRTHVFLSLSKILSLPPSKDSPKSVGMMDSGALPRLHASPISEEGLLIGVAIVIILILLGVIFGIFQWISGSLLDLFSSLGLG